MIDIGDGQITNSRFTRAEPRAAGSGNTHCLIIINAPSASDASPKGRCEVSLADAGFHQLRLRHPLARKIRRPQLASCAIGKNQTAWK
jgi:hypothetical protein